MELRTVYRDDWLVVFDKPSGLLAVPGRGPDKQDCAATRVQRQLPQALVVHRLDRDTSGLLLMALDLATQRALGMLFEQRQVAKRYAAVVHGVVAEEQGRIELPLGKDWDHPPRHRVDFERGRPACTEWRVVAREADRTRLVLIPHTGRSHQLRVHLAALGHPILGDPLYASAAALQLAPRLLLHAEELQLTHPATGEPMHWTAPAPF